MEILEIYLRSSVLARVVYCYYMNEYKSFNEFFEKIKLQYTYNQGNTDHSIFDSNNVVQTKDEIIKILTKLEAIEILNLP